MENKKAYETYKKVKTLGVGSFGTAYLVDCQQAKQLAVIKQIDIEKMNEEERRETLREAKILEVLQHPNIIRFKEVYKTKKGKLCIVMDFADGGDLQGKIKEKYKIRDQTGGKLQYWSEDHVLNWFTQICLALKHVHDRKILHRDLKSQNIFLTQKGMIKLGDFGIARVLSDTKSKAKTVVGVLLYEMCALQPPFNAQSLHQLAQKILSGKYPDVPSHFSGTINNLLQAMLNKDPNKRPNINQVLKYPVIYERIQKLLNEQDFKDEFSHTILHNQNVFDQFRVIQAEKKAAAEKLAKEAADKKMAEEEAKANARKQAELEEKMAAMKLNEYQPKYGQDKQLFNEMYMNYISELHAADDKSEASTPSVISERPYSQQSSAASQIDQEDRNNDYEDEQQTQQTTISSGPPTISSNQSLDQQRLNISACDFDDFSKYMISQYGENQFRNGYVLIKSNRNILYQENGEKQLLEMLRPLQFKGGDEAVTGFINFCTTYLIVQNMQA